MSNPQTEAFGGGELSEQPDPTPSDSRPVWDLVIEDMRARDQTGRERYGVPLQAGNGRDALRDAYEEALDLAVYLRQAIAERDFRRAEPPVPRPLFEAALRVHHFWGAAPEADLRMLVALSQPGDCEWDTAERIIRRAAACGVGEGGDNVRIHIDGPDREFKPGDPRPEGYFNWYEWAEVQHKAGLKQQRCCRCVKWYYPQELSDQVHVSKPFTKDGTVVVTRGPICLACAEKQK